ncbi:MAG: hypothetical protein ACOVQA_04695 [Thermoflexibacteraceae bacterium]
MSCSFSVCGFLVDGCLRFRGLSLRFGFGAFSSLSFIIGSAYCFLVRFSTIVCGYGKLFFG